MRETTSDSSKARQNGSLSERRRFTRKPVPQVFVAVELSDTPGGRVSSELSDTPGNLSWAGSAIDISPEGLGLTLPEDIPVGAEVLLTFWLDDATVFSRVPSVVIRKEHGFGFGAVRFDGWSSHDVEALRSYLQAA